MSGVVGLDLSLTATGWAVSGEGAGVWKPKTKGVDRLREVEVWVRELCDEVQPDVVVIEGYSFNSRVGGERLGEFGGVVRLTLAVCEHPYVEVPPAVLKKFATGKGNVGKDAMLAAAVRAGFGGEDNNAADAWWLMQMGLLYVAGAAEIPTTTYRADAISRVEWPALGEAA